MEVLYQHGSKGNKNSPHSTGLDGLDDRRPSAAARMQRPYREGKTQDSTITMPNAPTVTTLPSIVVYDATPRRW